MGRKLGSKNKSKGDAAPPPAESKIGHNGGPPELTDDQKQTLFFGHLKKIRAYKEKIASLSGELRAQYKLAKGDLGDDARASINDALLLETDEGQAKMEAAIARQARVALWMGIPIGSQPDLFGTDRAPATDRAFAAGKAARLNGEPCKPPHDPSVPQYDAWIQGHQAGQQALNDAQRRDDELAFGEADKALTGPFPDDPDAENLLDGDDGMAELVDAAEAE